MIYKQRKTSHIVIAALILLAILLITFNFITVPMQISTYSEVFPKERWLLTRGNGGQIISNLIDYSKGQTTQYDISQFERGEYVSVDFLNSIKDKREFDKGDTIIVMHSSDVSDRLITAEGELEVALANLNSQNSAQKEALVNEAESKLKYTEEKIGEQKILFDRTKQLFEKNLVSKQEYELQEWNLNLLEIEKKIYTSQLENLRTGVKPEEKRLLETQINAAKEKLEFLRERESQLVISLPINGAVTSTFSPDTLLNIVNYKQVVLHTPIRITDLQEFRIGQQISVSFPGLKKVLSGNVLSINKEVKLVNAQQAVFISVLFDNSANQLLPGMVVENSIKLKNITLLEQIIKIITE